MPESTHPYIAVGVIVLVFIGLQVRRGAATDLLFLGGLMMVTLCGVIEPRVALQGFSNPAMLTVAAFLVIAAGLRNTGVLDWLGRLILGSVRDERTALRRLAPVLIGASAFLLNTALVAMMMPMILDWCRRRNIAPSRLLIPLSYLVILGGVCTLVGTSTTLVVNGLLRDMQREESTSVAVEGPSTGADERTRRAQFSARLEPMSLFEIGYVGLPTAVIGGIFLVFAAPRLLPRRADIVEEVEEQRREYLVEMLVQGNCPLIGTNVEDAGLRHLPGLFLIEIDREGEIITPVTPEDVVRSGDRLVFSGVVSTIVDLKKIPGLVPAADSTYELALREGRHRHLTEVVLSRTSPLIGTTVREAKFRQRYNAAIVAVHRNGVRLTNKIGNIVLEPGDTLLLQTRSEFVSTYRNSRDFFLVSRVKGSLQRQHHKMRVAAILAGILVLWLCLGQWLASLPLPGLASPAIAAIVIACLMLLTRCLRTDEARSALDLQMLITIAAALGLGRALTESGAAEGIATFCVYLVGGHPYLLLVGMYLLAVVFTEVITNNAVAAMLVPLAIAVAWQGQYDPRPFIMAITMAASLSFMTPIGYQTNLMVLGPGGYKPRDYLRCGVPMAVVVGCSVLLLIPRIWPF